MTETIAITHVQDIAVVTVNNPPVNILDHGLRQALFDAFARLSLDDKTSAIILTCAGRTFFAGVDIKEFDQLPFKDPWLPELIQKVEDSHKPVLAAIHGSALGGGLELAMGCHYRCAVPNASLGLPEVTLGLLPGATGTQRLPRLVGVDKALDMMLSGKPLKAADALECGLIDKIIESDLLDGALAFASEILHHDLTGRRLSRVELQKPPEIAAVLATHRQSIEKRARGFLAPLKIMRCVEAALALPYDEALQVEAELFLDCLRSQQSKAQRHLFFAEREIGKIPGIPRDMRTRPVESVAVIGAGTMGRGIALCFLNAGFPLTLLETNQDALQSGLDNIRSSLVDQVAKGRISEEGMAAITSALTGQVDYAALRQCDLVIEAVFENLAIKQEVFKKLDRVCKPGAILATNTSALNINVIAASTRRPQDVIGLHFFAPANVMPLLEIVRAEHTAKEVVVTAISLSKTIRKTGVVVGVCFGFVGNRMFLPYVREAELMALEGAGIERIDQVACDWGMAMGPHAVTDLSGQDVFYKLNQQWPDRPDDPAYFRICEALVKMERLGQKTGRGKYRYSGRKAEVDDEIEAIIAREAQALGIVQREHSDREILERLLYSMINEGARVLQERIALRPGDIDVIFANGYGMPRYRGGPMYYADQVGLRNIRDRILGYGRTVGERYWKPAPLLDELADKNSSFTAWSINGNQ